MTDSQLIDGLLLLADDERLTEGESDLIITAVRVIESKKRKALDILIDVKALKNKVASL